MGTTLTYLAYFLTLSSNQNMTKVTKKQKAKNNGDNDDPFHRISGMALVNDKRNTT